jgi:hypothetical protein
MNFGGPVWHASGRGGDLIASQRIAIFALKGVGDARRGEWRERGRGGVYHIRRRLSAEEQLLVGEARDIRGSVEMKERVDALLAEVDPRVRDILLREGVR